MALAKADSRGLPPSKLMYTIRWLIVLAFCRSTLGRFLAASPFWPASRAPFWVLVLVVPFSVGFFVFWGCFLDLNPYLSLNPILCSRRKGSVHMGRLRGDGRGCFFAAARSCGLKGFSYSELRAFWEVLGRMLNFCSYYPASRESEYVDPT